MKKSATFKQVEFINQLQQDISPTILEKIKKSNRISNKPAQDMSLKTAHKLIQALLYYKKTGLTDKPTKSDIELDLEESMRNLRKKLRGKVD
ncbi:MAG: hypothetical protein HC874_27505 [Richelia sp. SL_2_1]|nr:hypothetical protein [Richelia sp. SL_2_1]